MTAVLGVRSLRFAYPRCAELFEGFSHDFTPGRVSALSGPSGCGKSTLLYVLGLLLTPTSGEVTLNGEPVSNSSDAARAAIRAHRLGFVFQDAELDPTRRVIDSVLEPALYAGRANRRLLPRATKLLERFGLGERANHKPGQVSGGQAQRFALCRALLNDPDIVLADEPTGNLDRDNAVIVLEAFQAAAADGRTVVIASHDPFVLERAGDVVRL